MGYGMDPKTGLHSPSQDVEVNAVGERNPVKSEWVLQGVKGRGGDANPQSHHKS